MDVSDVRRLKALEAENARLKTGACPEFTGKAMLERAHRHGFELRLIQPGIPNRNA